MVETEQPGIPAREMERMMKLQDVILKATENKLTWIEAAEIAGMSVRNMQRKRQAYQQYGYTGLFDQRRGKRSIHRIPMETAERKRSRTVEDRLRRENKELNKRLGTERQNWILSPLPCAESNGIGKWPRPVAPISSYSRTPLFRFVHRRP
jgi:hypothetical protein